MADLISAITAWLISFLFMGSNLAGLVRASTFFIFIF